MTDPVSAPNSRKEYLLESLSAGVLGGSAVALFFLLFDIIDGRPFL